MLINAVIFFIADITTVRLFQFSVINWFELKRCKQLVCWGRLYNNVIHDIIILINSRVVINLDNIIICRSRQVYFYILSYPDKLHQICDLR